MSLTTQQILDNIESFKDVVIVPYEVILQRSSAASFEHQGGPILPDWNHQSSARFCRDGKPVDIIPVQPDSVNERIDEPAVWCGPCYTHFGHQIVDFSTRILQGVTSYPNARFLFAPSIDSGIKTIDDTPDFFRALLDWYGISINQVTLITTPTMVSNLYIPPQAEQLFNTAPSQAYLDLLDNVVEKNFAHKQKSGTVFISRAGQPYCFAGESYLETLFLSVGIDVVRPELLPLREQLECYYSAEHLIFSEGSAITGLLLLGRSVGDVTFIQRRKKLKFTEDSYRQRSRNVEFLNLLAGLVHGMRFNGRERLHQSLSIFDENALLDYLNSIDPRMVEYWNTEQFNQARDQDISRWIDVESRNPASQAPNSTKTVILRLQELNLEHMIPLAEKHLPNC